jgi:hypothetical protein
MKKQLIKKNIGLLTLLFLFVGKSYAQVPDYKELSPITITSTGAMDENVKAAFNRDFKQVSNVTWFKMEKNTMIRFVMNNIIHRILYNQRGIQIYHIIYTEAKDMQSDVVNLVENSYGSYTLLRGIHILQGNIDIWIVCLEDSKNLIFVRVENGETELVEVHDRG